MNTIDTNSTDRLSPAFPCAKDKVPIELRVDAGTTKPTGLAQQRSVDGKTDDTFAAVNPAERAAAQTVGKPPTKSVPFPTVYPMQPGSLLAYMKLARSLPDLEKLMGQPFTRHPVQLRGTLGAGEVGMWNALMLAGLSTVTVDRQKNGRLGAIQRPHAQELLDLVAQEGLLVPGSASTHYQADGLCVVRALALEAERWGVAPENMRYLWLAPEQFTSGSAWQFHKALAIKAAESDANGGWWVLDPLAKQPQSVEDWCSWATSSTQLQSRSNVMLSSTSLEKIGLVDRDGQISTDAHGDAAAVFELHEQRCGYAGRYEGP